VSFSFLQVFEKSLESPLRYGRFFQNVSFGVVWTVLDDFHGQGATDAVASHEVSRGCVIQNLLQVTFELLHKLLLASLRGAYAAFF
jgi:hypothetical protein